MGIAAGSRLVVWWRVLPVAVWRSRSIVLFCRGGVPRIVSRFLPGDGACWTNLAYCVWRGVGRAVPFSAAVHDAVHCFVVLFLRSIWLFPPSAFPPRNSRLDVIAGAWCAVRWGARLEAVIDRASYVATWYPGVRNVRLGRVTSVVVNRASGLAMARLWRCRGSGG